MVNLSLVTGYFGFPVVVCAPASDFITGVECTCMFGFAAHSQDVGPEASGDAEDCGGQ